MIDPNHPSNPLDPADPDLIDPDAIDLISDDPIIDPTVSVSGPTQQRLPNPIALAARPLLDPRSDHNPYHGIKRFLVFASGARPEILAQCPTDEGTHLGLGGTVVATAGLSAISMVFALHNALHLNLFPSLIAGLVWALIIFNMDRWLIVSQKRLASPWKQWINVIPRVIVALLLGFVISEPLIHQLFRSELDRQIEVNLADSNKNDIAKLEAKSKEFIDQKTARLNELSDTSQVTIGSEASIKAEIDTLKKEIADAQTAYNTAQTELTAEIEGISATGKAGCGQACAVKRQVRDQKLELLNQAKDRNEPRIAEKQAALDTAMTENADARQQLIKDRETERAAITTAINEETETTNTQIDKIRSQSGKGLLADISALGTLESQNGGVALAHYLILFLFVALDTIPVIGKTLMLTGEKRSYERICDAIDTKTRLDAEQLVADAEYEQEQHVNLVRADADIRTQVQIDNNEYFVRTAAETQREVGEMLLDQWRENEVARIRDELKKNPPQPI